MKVKELIEKLSRLPQEHEVTGHVPEWDYPVAGLYKVIDIRAANIAGIVVLEFDEDS